LKQFWSYALTSFHTLAMCHPLVQALSISNSLIPSTPCLSTSFFLQTPCVFLNLSFVTSKTGNREI
jgi:hypothetical protein